MRFPTPPRVVKTRTDSKATLAGGIGVHLWKFFFDAAVEGFIPLDAGRVIAVQGPDNEAGKYKAQVISVELSGQIRF